MRDEMTEALDTLLLCQALEQEDRDLVERALDEGYGSLPEMGKSRLRRLLNQQAAKPLCALERYRLRRQMAAPERSARRQRGARATS